MRILSFIICSFALLSGRLPLFCQETNYEVQHFNNENGLPQNSIKALQFDTRGYLWMGTEMGLVRYDGSIFKIFDQSNYPLLQANRIVFVESGPDSVIYFGTENNHFYNISSGGNLSSIKSGPLSERWKKEGGYLFAYRVFDSIDSRIKRGKLPSFCLPDIASMRKSVLNTFVRKNDTYYFLNAAADLVCVDTALHSFRKISLTGIDPVNRKNLTLIGSGPDLYIRAGKYVYTLNFQAQDQAQAQPILKVGDIPNLTCIAKAPAPDMWVVGTMDDGCFFFKRKHFGSRHLPDAESNVFYALAQFGQDGFLTKKGFFNQGHWTSIPQGYTSETILAASTGRYYLNRWQGREKAGISILDSNMNELQFILSDDLRATCIQEFSDKSIWISAQNRYLGKILPGYISWLPRPPDLSPKFEITTFLQAKGAWTWLAGPGGLARINPANGRVTLIPELTNIYIRTLHEDKNGTIWIGSYGYGFFCWKAGKLFRFPMDPRKHLLTAHSFVEDNKGGIWISTNQGLFYTHLQDLYDYTENTGFPLYYHYFEKSSGFPTNEFNGGCTPSGIRLKNGSIAFPSIQGVVVFAADSIPIYLSESPIYIDAIQVNKSTNAVHDEKRLVLDKGVEMVSFEISSPYYDSKENRQIEYRLDNFSNSWSPLPDNQKLVFEKLPAGNYTLELRKKAGFGPNNLIGSSYAIRVKPFFYETAWFKIGCLLLLLLLMAAIFRFRLTYLIRQKKYLEYEIQVRTAELTYLVADLESTVIELEASKEKIRKDGLFRQHLAMIIAHDLQSPLRFLANSAEWLYEKYAADPNQDFSAILREISNTSNVNHRFIEDIAWWIRSMENDFKVNQKIFTLAELLLEITDFIAPLANEKNNWINLEIDPGLQVKTDRQLLKVIIRNLVDNANKFSRDNEIKITAEEASGKCTIVVTDFGSGIRPNTLLELKARLAEDDPELHYSSRGNGFRFVADFARLLNLQVSIQSETEGGTSISLAGLENIYSNEPVHELKSESNE